jgi:hypothetical protein
MERLNELHDTKEQCQSLCCDVERGRAQIKCLEVQLDAEMKKTCQLAQELRCASEMAKQSAALLQQQQQCHEKEIAKGVNSAGNCSKGNHELLINAIKDMKKRYDAVKKNEIELVDGYERRIEEMQTKHCEEIERMRCSFKDDSRNCTCEWSTNEEDCSSSDEADVLLIRKLHKFGIQSLTSEELHDLHCRVRCAMMKTQDSAAVAPATTNAGIRSNNNAEYFRRICDELKAKYNLSDQISPLSTDNVACSSLTSRRSTSNLQNIPERDTDLTSARTAPVLSRGKSPRGDGKKREKRRAKSTHADTRRHGEKLAKCVTISRKNFK